MKKLGILTGQEGFERFAAFLNFSKEEKRGREQALRESFMPF